MLLTDALPSRGAGVASCSYDRWRPSVGRRLGRGAAVPRARRRQQGDQPWSPSSEAIGLAFGVLQHQLFDAAPALAEDLAAYDASGVSDGLKNAFGVAYVAVLIGFGIRLFSKRAQRFTTERIAQPGDDAVDRLNESDPVGEQAKTSPLAALFGAAQAAFFTVVLYTLATQMDGFFAAQQVPGQYTARNISVTIRTIVQGLSYLLTFLFAANTIGLTALAIQLALFPDMDLDAPQLQNKPRAELPKVSLTDDIGAIRRAFRELETQSQKQQAKDTK